MQHGPPMAPAHPEHGTNLCDRSSISDARFTIWLACFELVNHWDYDSPKRQKSRFTTIAFSRHFVVIWMRSCDWTRTDNAGQLAFHNAFQSTHPWISIAFLAFGVSDSNRTGLVLTGPPLCVQGRRLDFSLADNASELDIEPVGDGFQNEKARYRKARVQQAITGTLWTPHGRCQPMVDMSAIPGSLQSAVVPAFDL